MINELQPGDRVVALASCARAAALIVGAVAAGTTVWLAKHRASLTALSAVCGAVLGFFIGLVISRLLFPATQGNVVVVKVGSASLPQTIKAALGAALPVAIIVSTLCSLLTRSAILTGMWPSLAAGAVIGICWALLASLT